MDVEPLDLNDLPAELRAHLPSKVEELWIAQVFALDELNLAVGRFLGSEPLRRDRLAGWIALHIEEAKIAASQRTDAPGRNALYRDQQGTIFSVATGDGLYGAAVEWACVHCDLCDDGSRWGAHNLWGNTWVCHVCDRHLAG
jgi:hypothetical protein